jgi:hypothetical protein
MHISFSKEADARSNSEADTPIIARRLESRYANVDPSKDQTARISLQSPAMSKNTETKTKPVRHLPGAARLILASNHSPDPEPRKALNPARQRLSAAGEALSTATKQTPQPQTNNKQKESWRGLIAAPNLKRLQLIMRRGRWNLASSSPEPSRRPPPSGTPRLVGGARSQNLQKPIHRPPMG